jgi:hypothetical protein
MTLIQLLLPARGRASFTDADLAATRDELVREFGGVTAYVRAPAAGAWQHPSGAVEDDDVVMVEVVIPHFDRDWWRGYVETLRHRFHQTAIHARAIAMEFVGTDLS